MATYELVEDGFVFKTVEADSAEEALDQVEIGNGSYDTSKGTVWTEVYANRVDLALSDEEQSAIPYSVVAVSAGEYATTIDHDGHAHEAGDCELCDEELASIVEALPGEWFAEFTGEGTGSELDVRVWLNGYHDDDSTGRTFAIEPEEPPCPGEKAHDWESPHAILGGLEENPGIWGHGGGVVIKEVCVCCGCLKTTDTWAQNPSNGEQGLTSVAYSPGEYRDEVRDLTEAESA
jgi:hypothetical protein